MRWPSRWMDGWCIRKRSPALTRRDSGTHTLNAWGRAAVGFPDTHMGDSLEGHARLAEGQGDGALHVSLWLLSDPHIQLRHRAGVEGDEPGASWRVLVCLHFCGDAGSQPFFRGGT